MENKTNNKHFPFSVSVPVSVSVSCSLKGMKRRKKNTHILDSCMPRHRYTQFVRQYERKCALYQAHTSENVCVFFLFLISLLRRRCRSHFGFSFSFSFFFPSSLLHSNTESIAHAQYIIMKKTHDENEMSNWWKKGVRVRQSVAF